MAVVLLCALGCSRTADPVKPAASTGSADPAAPARAALAAALSGEPTVTFAMPRGDVSSPSMGAVAFDRAMVALGAVDVPVAATQVQLVPPVPLRVQWMGTSTLGFWPTRPLPGSTRFTGRLTGLVALDGKPVADYTWTFRTPLPRVLRSWPASGDNTVEPGSRIALLFDQPIDLSSLQAAAHLESKAGPMPALTVKAATDEDRAWVMKRQGDSGLLPKTLEERLVILAPAAPLPADTDVALVVAPGVRGAEGPEPSESPWRLDFHTLGPLTVIRAGCDDPCDPDGWAPIHIATNNRLIQPRGVEADSLTRLLTVTPPVPGLRMMCWGTDCSLSAPPIARAGQPTTSAWKAGQTYKVVLAPGLTDLWGQRLKEPKEFEVKMGRRLPRLDAATDGSVFELAGKPHRFGYDLRNVPQINAKAMRVTRANIAQVLDQLNGHKVPLGHRPPPPPKFDFDVNLDVRGTDAADTDQRRIVDLDKALGDKPGALLLDVSSPATESRVELRERRLVGVTDLQVLAKLGAKSSVFWVTSFSTGKPVPGAVVALVDAAGQETWKGTTNADGLGTGPGGLFQPERYGSPEDGEEGEERPADPPVATLVASLGEDWTWLRLDGSQRSDGDWGSGPSATGGLRGLMFMDKNVYKKGETAHFKGIVRRLSPSGLTLVPGAEPVRIELRDPDNRVAAEVQTTLSAKGSFDGEFLVPKAGSYGDWRVVARVGGAHIDASFEVLVYRTPKFKMSASLDRRHYVVGDKVKGVISASYYSGGPLDNAQSTLDISGYATEFSPPGWEGFRFGYDLYEVPGTVGIWSEQQKGQLDAKGQWAFALATDRLNLRSSVPFEIEATATDPTGQPVAQRTQGWLHPSLAHAGIRATSTFVESGKPLELEVIATTQDGKPLSGLRLDVQVIRHEFKQVRQETIGGQLEWVSAAVEVPVGSCALTSANNPTTCAVPVDRPGRYAARVTAADAKGRLSRAADSAYVVGPGTVAWNRGDDEGSILQSDKTSYKVGETARLLVKNKVGATAMLVTLERDGILETRSVALSGDVTTVVVPMEARLQPNVHVTVSLYAGRKSEAVVGQPDVGAPVLDTATVGLSVEVVDRRLAVQLKTGQQRYRPKEEVEVRIEVKDSDGKPAPGEVTLWAVDEGVLALTGHETPDPLGPLFAAADRGVGDFATIEALIRGRLGEEKGDTGGGGGDSGPKMRGDFKDVPVWLPSIQVGPDGLATAHFTLPDNLTSFRIMAVAVSGADRAGRAETPIQVDKPLMLLTTWPKQVHLGDQFEVALVTRNRSAGPLQGTASVQVVAVDGLAAVDGDAQVDLQLARDQSAEVHFQLRATAVGPVKVGVRVQANGPKTKDGKAIAEQDGIEEDVEIVDPASMEAVATFDESDVSVSQALQKAAARPGLGGLEVSAAATGLLGLQGSVDFLIQYPFGCTEQLASQLVALLWLEQVGKSYDILPDKQKDARQMAQEAVDQIAARRASLSAGLTLWPGEAEANVLATAWGLRVLAQAQKQGLRVDEKLTRDGAAWLRARLTGKDPDAEHADKEALSGDNRAMVLAALAAVGQPATGDVETLFAERAALSPSGQLLLAEASLAEPRGVPRAQTIVSDLTRNLHVDAATAHLVDTDHAGWSSEVRTNAQLLSVMMRLGGDHPMAPRIARWLLEQRGADRTGTTQENAWVLQAAGAWLQAREGNRQDIGLAVSLGGNKVGATKLSARTLEPWKVFIKQADIPSGLSVLGLDKEGGGTLYYTLRYSYALKTEAEVARNAGFFIKRVVIDEEGRVQPSDLQRGKNAIVTLVLLTDRQRDDVAIVDQLPAGLEPVDFSLETSPRAVLESMQRLQASMIGAQLGGDQGQTVGDGETWSHRELAGREVRWFADHLEPGLHVLTYVARAAVRGDFQGRGAKVQSMYHPEVFGTSGPNRLRIR